MMEQEFAATRGLSVFILFCAHRQARNVLFIDFGLVIDSRESIILDYRGYL